MQLGCQKHDIFQLWYRSRISWCTNFKLQHTRAVPIAVPITMHMCGTFYCAFFLFDLATLVEKHVRWVQLKNDWLPYATPDRLQHNCAWENVWVERCGDFRSRWRVIKWICDFLLKVRQSRGRLCQPVFICYFFLELICTLDCVCVMCLIVFELRNNRLLDQTTTALLQNDWTLFMIVSGTKLLQFFI